MKEVKAICYGEVLFDIFPDEERIGGAPLNVAARLSSLGVKTQMISKIGSDRRGKKIKAYLEKEGVETSTILLDTEYPTGVVNVSLSSSGSATYEIAYPAAWDKIEITPAHLDAAQEADLFIFGSLVCRDQVSRNSLMELLTRARYKVLDFNLRPPHYNSELLLLLLNFADFLKFNDDELFEIAAILGSTFNSLEQNLLFVARNSSVSTICVTKGRHGAVMYRDGELFYNSGFKIEVKDTVGAGDSFLAGLLAKLFQGADPQSALDYACALGALVAAEPGANPKVDSKEVEQFISGFDKPA